MRYLACPVFCICGFLLLIEIIYYLPSAIAVAVSVLLPVGLDWRVHPELVPGAQPPQEVGCGAEAVLGDAGEQHDVNLY